MALTLSEIGGTRLNSGQLRGAVYDITFDASYPTGGETLNAEDVGLDVVLAAQQVGGHLTSGAAMTTQFLLNYDPSTRKLQLFTSNGAAAALLAEFTNGGDASTRIFRMLFWGY
jgi:hypothetical protein